MIVSMDVPAINPEQLAYWYFRLNGFMTTVNFVVHPEEGSGQRTDVDVLGVRFPYRAELLSQPMVDDVPFTQEKKRPFVVIAEVKRDRCNLNGPWTRPEDKNMHRVLTAIGAIHPQEQDAAAESLYQTGVFQGGQVLLSLCCVGACENPERRRRYPAVPQILWPQVASFIHRRFDKYHCQKLSHPQWDETGRALWKLFEDSQSLDRFVDAVQKAASRK
jgi:hypothetical protein